MSSTARKIDIDKLKSIQVSPSATPSRRNKIPPRRPQNNYERGTVSDDRGMPILSSTGEPVSPKEYTNKYRHLHHESIQKTAHARNK